MSTEQAVTFKCNTATLFGIVTLPEPTTAAPELGMLIVVGGPQYRAGSHRQFVHLARLGAAAGLPTLRFDCRGMGDSEGEQREFDEMDDDIASAIEALLRHVPSLRRIVLCALCDGASASLLYLQRRGPDERIDGLVLMNPWTRTTAGQAETRVRHYYRGRLLSADFWRKLFGGDVARGAFREAFATLKTMLSARRNAGASPGAAAGAPHFLDLMAEGILAFKGTALIVTSGRDYTASEFLLNCQRDARWRQVMARPNTQHVELPQADHTFSSLAQERELHRHCLHWLRRFAAVSELRATAGAGALARSS